VCVDFDDVDVDVDINVKTFVAFSLQVMLFFNNNYQYLCAV
jgi:hypothetical protein